jgi:hypothetical protein
MQARHFALLARGHGGRLLDAGGVLSLEVGVIAGPVRERPAFEIHDAIHDVVEELAIVRDQQQCSLEPLQPAFEPQYGVEIEVVGRFVEHEYVGPRHERARHVGAHLQAARQLLHLAFDVRGREPETVGELRRARRRGVTAGEIVVA